MTPLERLRLAVALGHAVVGAEIRLVTGTGDVVSVAAHPASDVDPCAMRRAVAAACGPDGPDVASRIVAIDVAGSLDDLGGGVHRTTQMGSEQRWIASLLQPDRVAELLGDIDHDMGDALQACLQPDSCLGVTVLAITAGDAEAVHELDRVAAEAAAAIFAAEVVAAADGVSRRPIPGVDASPRRDTP